MGTRQELARRWPALFAAAVLLLLVAFARPAAGDEHGGMDHGGGDDHGAPGEFAPPESYAGLLPPGDWTPEQVEKAKDLVHRTEVSLSTKFDTLEKIQALGYRNFGVTAPGGWDHWGKGELNHDDHILDPDFPETVVFKRDSDGVSRVYAAMFQLESPPWTVDHLPEGVEWYPGWHNHDGEFCTDLKTGGWKGFPPCAEGSTSHHPEPMMHVWIKDIPDCNNRFGGIGVGGVHCDHGDHPMPPPALPPFFPPGTRGGTVPPQRPAPPGDSHGGDDHEMPPATPVPATPHFTG